MHPALPCAASLPIEALARDPGIPSSWLPIERTELLTAEAIAAPPPLGPVDPLPGEPAR
jgi:hypothetical protein